MQQKNDFSTGDLRKTIVRLSLPLILAQMVNVLYNIVDRIYIGQMPKSSFIFFSSMPAPITQSLPITPGVPQRTSIPPGT